MLSTLSLLPFGTRYPRIGEHGSRLRRGYADRMRTATECKEKSQPTFLVL